VLFGLNRTCRRLAVSVMLAAAAAFALQGAWMAASEAAAAAGYLPDPAIAVHGHVHSHGTAPGHLHVHGGDNGHVHQPADTDGFDPADEGTDKGKVWRLGCAFATAVLPALDLCASPFRRTDSILPATNESRAGTAPDGLRRPPRPPGMG
jgi:hypothetical protein